MDEQTFTMGSSGGRLRPVAAWTLSFAALAAVVFLRWLLDPVLANDLPLVTLFGAVAISVWLGRWPAGVTSTLLGWVACSLLFIAPRGALLPTTVRDFVGLVAYLFTCALIVAIGEAMHHARQRDTARRELLRVTLASIGDGVITTDTAGRVTYLNGVAEALTGWKLAEARERTLDEVFRILAEDGRRPLESPATRALREGTVVGLRNHTVLVAKDGREHTIDDSAAPIRDEAGRVAGCVLIFRDVSQRRRWEIERAERLSAARVLAAIVESSDDAIISKSLDGTIRSWNAGAERIFGYRADEAVGKHISLVIPPDRIDEEDEIIASLKAGRRVDHFETRRRRKDGALLTVSLTISPIRDDQGTVVGASKIARDVSERKGLEDDLRKLAGDLAEADRRKDEFLATLSHELRNPLAPMRTMVEVLKAAQGDERRRNRALEVIDRQLAHLVRLIDDLLDVNRINRNRLELRLGRVELASVLREAAHASEALAEAAGVNIVLDLPGQSLDVHGDSVRLVQVFANLLNNACKYTPRGGTVTVTATSENETAVISVRDTGTGIPTDQLDRIFDMFAQLHRSGGRARDGLGIGLTLVRRLVELHGGTVTARSAGEDRGSEFVVRLPLDRTAAAQAVSSPLAAPHAIAPQCILVVDDNADAAAALAMLLQLQGHRIFEAHDGETALTAAAEHRPDVVLLDIGLPILDGYEVCRRIRAQPWSGGMVIIALTGWGQEEDRKKSAAAGFDGHLVKPVDFDDLMNVLAKTTATRPAG